MTAFELAVLVDRVRRTQREYAEVRASAVKEVLRPLEKQLDRIVDRILREREDER